MISKIKMVKIWVCLFMLLFLIQDCQGSPYKRIIHSKDRGAVCLDGSPTAMYINEGSGPNKDKFLIHFKGGGFCGGLTLDQTIQSCYQRSFTDLGSSTNYPEEKNFDKSGSLSPLPEINPVFYDWTKIYIPYCDGSTHQGYR